MRPGVHLRLIACGFLVCVAAAGYAKDKKPAQNDASAQLNELLQSMTPVKSPATDAQIHEYFQFSHVIEDYKTAWAAGVDKNRAHSQPYLPDSYFSDIKTEIQDTDLAPPFTVWFKHTVSSELMDKVLDAYLKLGKNFPGSPMCTEIGKAQAPMGDQWNQMTILLARQVVAKVNAADKAKIDDARTQYAATHPGWVEQ